MINLLVSFNQSVVPEVLKVAFLRIAYALSRQEIHYLCFSIKKISLTAVYFGLWRTQGNSAYYARIAVFLNLILKKKE